MGPPEMAWWRSSLHGRAQPVRRLQFSTDAWVNFKLFGGMGLHMRSLSPRDSFPPQIYRGEEVMLYALTAEDPPDSLQRRLAARPAHHARLEPAGRRSPDPGRPLPGDRFARPRPGRLRRQPDRRRIRLAEDARAWADADPYVAAGVYAGHGQALQARPADMTRKPCRCANDSPAAPAPLAIATTPAMPATTAPWGGHYH